MSGKCEKREVKVQNNSEKEKGGKNRKTEMRQRKGSQKVEVTSAKGKDEGFGK